MYCSYPMVSLTRDWTLFGSTPRACSLLRSLCYAYTRDEGGNMIANIQLTMYVHVLVHVLYRYHKIKNPKQDPRLAPVADWQWENLYLFWIRVLHGLCAV